MLLRPWDVFKVCEEMRIPCIQIRSISNKVERRNKESWNLDLSISNLNTEVEGIINNFPSIVFTKVTGRISNRTQAKIDKIDSIKNTNNNILNNSANKKGWAPNLNNGLSQPIKIPSQIIPLSLIHI